MKGDSNIFFGAMHSSPNIDNHEEAAEGGPMVAGSIAMVHIT